MKKTITLVILLGIAWLGLAILFPNKNKSVKIKELNYASLFNDQNGVQLKSAAQFGIKQPLKNRNEADKVKDGLVRIRDNSHYSIAKLTHSIPYLTEDAARLLEIIGENFRDSLKAKGIDRHRIIVTSVLRTEEDVHKLMYHNTVAVKNSAHRHATTFDITYRHFETALFAFKTDEVELKKTLAEVLRDLRKDKLCYVRYEIKPGCFHITVGDISNHK
jgi:hypothetical protein